LRPVVVDDGVNIIGSDSMTVAGGAASPAGRLHAASYDTLTLCGSGRARFTWPALSWSPDGEDTCPECVAVFEAPAAQVAAPALAEAPAAQAEAPAPAEAPAALAEAPAAEVDVELEPEAARAPIVLVSAAPVAVSAIPTQPLEEPYPAPLGWPSHDLVDELPNIAEA
jgi:hypothetical protein